MACTRFSNTLLRVTAILCMAAVGLVLAFTDGVAEERLEKRVPLTVEQHKPVWTVMARCAAAALKIGREDSGKVVEAYVTARKYYADKTAKLPFTQEGWQQYLQQRREVAEKARSGWKEGLVKAVGAEKAEKIMGLLCPFGMTTFMDLDRMVTDLLALKLPREKMRKAVLAVMEYNRDVEKVFTEAREAGNSEGLTGLIEKMGAPSRAF